MESKALAQRPIDRETVDDTSAISAACSLVALSQLVINIQPMLLGSLANGYHYNDIQLGQISATFIGFTTIATLTSPLWIRRVDWRVFSLLMTISAVILLVAGGFVRGVNASLVLFSLLGAVFGGSGAPAFAALGDTSNPDRSYGWSVVIQSLAAALVAAPLSAFVIPKFGPQGLFIGLAILFAMGAVTCNWLPRAGRVYGEAESPATKDGADLLSAAAIPAWVAVLAQTAFIAGLSAFWFFMDRIGAARGTSSSLIGMTVSLCGLVSVASAAVVAWLGGRVSGFSFVAVGTGLTLLGFATLMRPGDLPFVTCSLAFAFGWGFAQPSYLALMRRVDATNRLFVAGPAAGGLAGVIAGIGGGAVITALGYIGLVLLSAALILAGGVLLLTAIGLSRLFDRQQTNRDRAFSYAQTTHRQR